MGAVDLNPAFTCLENARVRWPGRATAWLLACICLAVLPVAGKAGGDRISSNLLRELGRADTAAPGIRGDAVTDSADDSVRVDVVLADTADAATERRMEALGARVLHFSLDYRRATVEARNPDIVFALEASPFVEYLYRAHAPVTRVERRTATAHYVDVMADWRTSLNGEGQRVGILSDSFARTDGVLAEDQEAPANRDPETLEDTLPQQSGDLPDKVELRRDDADGGLFVLSDEGAAMGELIHHLAPDAGISFHTAFISIAAFAEGIDDLCTPSEDGGAGATVVVDDVIYPTQLYYQPGPVAQAARRCVTGHDVPFVTPAGNYGDNSLRAELDVAPDAAARPDRRALDEADLHDWGGGEHYLEVDVPRGESVSAVLQWNQPAKSPPASDRAPRIDLDLLALDAAGEGATELASSTNDQQATSAEDGADPIEIVELEAGRTNYLAVSHWAGERAFIPQDPGTPVEFRLVLFGGGGTVIEPPASGDPTGPGIIAHAAVPEAITVGAVPWFDTPEFALTEGPTHGMDPEPYSALGGYVRTEFAADGSFRPRPTLRKPELTAVDGTNTTFFGQDLEDVSVDGEPDGDPNFFGTSASAANAAGIVALLRQDDETASPAALADRLQASALDIDGERAAAGCDPVSGAGLAHAENARDDGSQPPVASIEGPDQVDPGDAITLSGTDSHDDDGIVDWHWSQLRGERVDLSGTDGESRIDFPAPSGSTTLEITLRVGDADCLEGRSSIFVRVGEGTVIEDEDESGGSGGSSGLALGPSALFLLLGAMLAVGGRSRRIPEAAGETPP